MECRIWIKTHALAAIRQLCKLEEILNRVETEREYSYCYINACMWDALNYLISNVLCCSFISVDAWLCWLHKLHVYLCSQPKVYTILGGYTRYLHLIITTTTFHWEWNRRQARLNSCCKVSQWTVVTNLITTWMSKYHNNCIFQYPPI